ncbi:Hexaprenyldihydroxybenzoate methyltransferase, mitochondrial [Dissophora globulifera]|uniref:Ubiquinone biosynthesis O-methyltransferase, mitochondrial n=1 Tax=Dissophora globulifera TaxID=979702 RepID=A0A9P6RCV8_9FUNG|nr:Hexaprenyldihydroxybenzoate methyltransferase, mitochondrial [Dissophora globulifera]
MSYSMARISSRISFLPRINAATAAHGLRSPRLARVPGIQARISGARVFSSTGTPHHSSTNDNNTSASSEPHSSSSVYTVNKEEIAKFAAMSDEWWAPQGPFKMLHLMNPPRIRYIRSRLEAVGTISSTASKRFPLQGLRVLDVGCGGGLLSESLARLGAQVTGLDASVENVQMALIHAKKDPLLNGGGPGSVEYRHQTAGNLLRSFEFVDMEQLVEEGLQFDVVCSLEVIEHVDNPAGFLKVLGDLLKPNGDLILSTMSRTKLSYFLTVLCAEHLLRMVPVGTHHWSKFINPEELAAGVEDLAKCQVVNIQGIGFNPLSGQWELTRSRDGSNVDSSTGSGGWMSLLGSPMAEAVNYFLSAKKAPAP